MTPDDEEAVVERAVEAVRRFEQYLDDPAKSGPYRGPTADGIISDWLEQQGHRRDGERWSDLVRAVALASWGQDWLERKRSRPYNEPKEERELRYYDANRPSSRAIDRIDQEKAA